MSEVTQEQIDKAIERCVWRKNVEGISVCGGVLAPCQRIIEKGQCDTLIKLFRGEINDE